MQDLSLVVVVVVVVDWDEKMHALDIYSSKAENTEQEAEGLILNFSVALLLLS
jgi:hypothetical protein